MGKKKQFEGLRFHLPKMSFFFLHFTVKKGYILWHFCYFFWSAYPSNSSNWLQKVTLYLNFRDTTEHIYFRNWFSFFWVFFYTALVYKSNFTTQLNFSTNPWSTIQLKIFLKDFDYLVIFWTKTVFKAVILEILFLCMHCWMILTHIRLAHFSGFWKVVSWHQY